MKKGKEKSSTDQCQHVKCNHVQESEVHLDSWLFHLYQTFFLKPQSDQHQGGSVKSTEPCQVWMTSLLVLLHKKKMLLGANNILVDSKGRRE